jgi:HEAT repeat protein
VSTKTKPSHCLSFKCISNLCAGAIYKVFAGVERREVPLPLKRHFRITVVLLMCAVSVSTTHAVTGAEKAWAMLEAASKSSNASERAMAIRALGLLRGDEHARKLAEAALEDPSPDVRIAGATALSQMRASESIPKLQKLLSDDKVSVVMAAAHSLRELKDNKSAYAVYYDILSGGRKTGGVLSQQLDTLHDPKALAKIGFEQGIGYVPFAGMGWDAWRYTHRKDPHPVRAIAASFLAHDPDPASGVALADAVLKDKDWIVRAAAIEALAQRGDPAFKSKVEYGFFDSNPHVRYMAAAAVIRLTTIAESRKEK